MATIRCCHLQVYFEEFSKCDAIDNNMAESFNAWILAARHKTIITMLEEIRKKVMQRIGQLREFGLGWPHDISPMSLKTLQDNISKSMKCSLVWNGDTGFEVAEPPKFPVQEGFTHKVDIKNMTCSCRSWMLKGIPCPHAIAAMHHRKMEPFDYVASCYRRETYLAVYGHFMQPLNNMEMWPESENPKVEPPLLKRMPGRPKKVRRKEPTETKKTGKLPKHGSIMTCRLCGGKNHNARGCPTKTAETAASSQTATGRYGRDQGQYTEVAAESSAAQAAQVTTRRGKRKQQNNEPTQPAAADSTQRTVPSPTQSTAARGRGSQTRGGGRGSHRQTAGQYKRPRMTGIGLLFGENGYTTLSTGGGSSRIIDPGTRHVRSSAEVTGDLGFQPPRGVKWKGRPSISTQGLERLRGERIIQARQGVAASTPNLPSQGSTTHSQPWKI